MVSLGAIGASSASAAVEYKWKVAGTELKTGETKGFTVNNDSKQFTLTGTVAGAKGELLSSNVSVAAGAKLIGGVPGKNEETVVFKEVKGDGLLAGCSTSQNGVASNSVQTVPLATEIVEGANGTVGTGEVYILFTPKTGTTFATFTFNGTCTVTGAASFVSGSILGLPLPQKTEVVKQNLVFEAVTKEYKVSPGTGATKTAGLTFAGNPATLTGLVLVLLESGQAYGAF